MRLLTRLDGPKAFDFASTRGGCKVMAHLRFPGDFSTIRARTTFSCSITLCPPLVDPCSLQRGHSGTFPFNLIITYQVILWHIGPVLWKYAQLQAQAVSGKYQTMTKNFVIECTSSLTQSSTSSYCNIFSY
jgi:hypothetical protein